MMRTNCMVMALGSAAAIVLFGAAEPTDRGNNQWEGDWETEGRGLSIIARNADTLAFELTGSSGASVGHIEGDASVEGNTARWSDEESGCLVTFTSLGHSIVVRTTSDCYPYFAGLGVQFDGFYVPEGSLSEQTFEALGLLAGSQDYALRKVVDGHYSRLVASFQRTETEEDQDGLGATVVTGGVRGLYTYMEGILMATPTGVWAAMLDDDVIRYFATSPEWKRNIPETIRSWAQDRRPDSQFVDENGEPL